jgi:hypothetical protein
MEIRALARQWSRETCQPIDYAANARLILEQTAQKRAERRAKKAAKEAEGR